MTRLAADGISLRHRRADFNVTRLYYITAGSGDALVVLDGFPEMSHAWRKVLPALAQHYTVIAPDLRGCGASDRPDTGYDKRTVAEDVHQLVQQLDLGPINLVSHDVGMMVGYAYAAAYSKDVRRLVITKAAQPGLGLEELYDADKFPRMYHLPLFDATECTRRSAHQGSRSDVRFALHSAYVGSVLGLRQKLVSPPTGSDANVIQLMLLGRLGRHYDTHIVAMFGVCCLQRARCDHYCLSLGESESWQRAWLAPGRRGFPRFKPDMMAGPMDFCNWERETRIDHASKWRTARMDLAAHDG